jgi:hypothetical protein
MLLAALAKDIPASNALSKKQQATLCAAAKLHGTRTLTKAHHNLLMR